MHCLRQLIAQIIKPHDARAADTLDDFVFLQEAPERVIQVAVLEVPVARDFQRHQSPGGLAFTEIEIRDRSGSNAANMAIAANERASEALRVTPRRALVRQTAWARTDCRCRAKVSTSSNLPCPGSTSRSTRPAPLSGIAS